MATRAIDLRAGQRRDAAKDSPTAVVGWAAVEDPADRVSFRDLFISHYWSFRERCRVVDEPSLILVAIDEQRRRVDGVLTVAARPDRVASAIVGRHGQAHLFLRGDDSLALRHLAVLVEPVESRRRGSAEVTHRILDLRSRSGFIDEAGRPLVAVRCEGTAFFRTASYALLFLAGGDPSEWPESASDAWSLIAERVTFDERTSGSAPVQMDSPRWPEGSALLAHPSLTDGSHAAPGRTTRVSLIREPRSLESAGESRGPTVGILDILSHGRHARVSLDETALEEGVLIGRYDRCDGATLLTDERISRAHLLVTAIAGRTYAVDTASSNGTLLNGEPLGVAELDHGAELVIGDAMRLRWSRCGISCARSAERP